ncbi:MAG: SemiSWEET family transporter [Candidatus Levyibacteriota bacterium]
MSHTFYNPHKKGKTTKRHLIDIVIYPLAIISPIMTIPQLLEIWTNGDVSGVSFSTWFAYAMVSGVWFVYGVSHKEKPIMISSSSLFILQSLIVVGVLINI